MKPTELVFFASRSKAVLILLGSIAFVALGWRLKDHDPITGWLGIIFFGVGIPGSLLMLLPGFISLRLHSEGLEMKSMFRSQLILWKDIKSFHADSVAGAKMIVICYRTHYVKQQLSRAGAKAWAGMDGAIPNSFNISPANLEQVLNEWLRRFGHDAPDPCSQTEA